mgnify:CR=1 FL=1
MSATDVRVDQPPSGDRQIQSSVHDAPSNEFPLMYPGRTNEESLPSGQTSMDWTGLEGSIQEPADTSAQSPDCSTPESEICLHLERDYAAINDVYHRKTGSIFLDNRYTLPARTCVEVSAMPTHERTLVEMKGVARLGTI